jgi:H+/Cl- antiporter ClcA
MGREGPAIHLGAANGSLIAEQLQVTRGAMRTLVGCGVAAAIGAAFNTPLAGVMIVIEVVLVEYSVRGFTPVLLAAVTGATVGRLVYGNTPAFYVPELLCGSLRELPWFAVMGFAIGAYSALFIRISGTILRSARRLPWWGAMLAASVVVGTLGLVVPQILGVGYDVIERTLKGQYAFGTIAFIAAGKLIATAVGVGARVPAGLIGPTFVMGAALGAVFGTVGTGLIPGGTSNIAFYAMVGMATMMGATLEAPLSALVAVLELTGNPHIILPGLVAIVTASVSLRHVFGCESVFVMQLRDMGYAGPSKV